MKNFWKQFARVKKPFFVLAPMAEVTDVVFRDFLIGYSRPDIMYTEFVSVRGLLSPQGRKHLERNLWYTLGERPMVAQIFGGDPNDFEAGARYIRELGFDGLDINMGCPDKKVEKQGAGASLMRDPNRAKEIVLAAKRGAGDMPVSVKTRIGYSSIETDEWIGMILEAGPAAIVVHGRTRSEMSKVPTHWEEIAKATRMAHECGIIAIGNGDVINVEQGRRCAEMSGADGIMIGRGVFGNPWVFGDVQPIDREEKLRAVAQLAVQFEGFWGMQKNFHILKRHFKAYVEGFENAKLLRSKLMETKNTQEVLDVLRKYFHEQQRDFSEVRYKPLEIAEQFLKKGEE